MKNITLLTIVLVCIAFEVHAAPKCLGGTTLFQSCTNTYKALPGYPRTLGNVKVDHLVLCVRQQPQEIVVVSEESIDERHPSTEISFDYRGMAQNGFLGYGNDTERFGATLVPREDKVWRLFILGANDKAAPAAIAGSEFTCE